MFPRQKALCMVLDGVGIRLLLAELDDRSSRVNILTSQREKDKEIGK